MRALQIIAILLAVFLIGCDVRKSDKQTTLPVAVTEEIKDPTTIEIIDSSYDFGTAREGEIVEYSYRFRNTGSKPLVVSNVAASCGCTVADKPEAPVRPGDIGFIKVKFNTENRPGEARKTVTVSSNAQPPFPELLMKGTVTGKE